MSVLQQSGSLSQLHADWIDQPQSVRVAFQQGQLLPLAVVGVQLPDLHGPPHDQQGLQQAHWPQLLLLLLLERCGLVLPEQPLQG